jgi:purine-binding chemotaxis protein CheW
VVFSIAGAKYGVPMSQVLEVCELNRFTPVPNVPEWVVGVVNLRGDIISIVDMRMLARLEQDDFTSQRHLIVAQTVEEDLTTCLMVEDVLGLANVETPKIQTIDRLIGDGLTPYTRGVYSQSNELLSILNLEGLLRSLEIAA